MYKHISAAVAPQGIYNQMKGRPSMPHQVSFDINIEKQVKAFIICTTPQNVIHEKQALTKAHSQHDFRSVEMLNKNQINTAKMALTWN